MYITKIENLKINEWFQVDGVLYKLTGKKDGFFTGWNISGEENFSEGQKVENTSEFFNDVMNGKFDKNPSRPI